MSKLKSIFSWLLGLIISKLRGIPAVSKLTKFFRLRYPTIWMAVIKTLSPFYWTYQVKKHNDSEDALFKEISAFNEQQWQKKTLRKQANISNLTRSGVMNNRPVVEAAMILERINKANALHKH